MIVLGESAISVPSSIKSRLQCFRLNTLTQHQVAPIFREKYIHTGYRLTDQPWSYYWKSLFKLHNETANVWSHLIAAAMVLKCVLEFSDICDLLNDRFGSAVIVFGLGCFIGMFTSASVHLFHSKSIRWHYLLFLTDYAGVTVYTFASGLSCMYIFSQRDMYHFMEHFYLPANAIFSWITFYAFVKAKLVSSSHAGRQAIILAAIVTYCTIICFPVLGRYVECAYTPGCSVFSLNHLTICLLGHIISACTFAAHVPERFAPGKFDLIGQGHFIFHLLSMTTIYMEFVAARKDLISGAAAHVSPNLSHILITYLLLIVAKILTIYYFRDSIVARVKEQMAWNNKLRAKQN